MKTCTKCNEKQPLDAFELCHDKSNPALRRNVCRKCRRDKPTAEPVADAPAGFLVKGTSTLYGADGAIKAQWVKTRKDQEELLAAMAVAVGTIADAWPARAVPVKKPRDVEADLLCVYPMGDPHIGMYAWAREAGAHFDLKIAERNLYAAVDNLVGRAPRAKQALVINIGDFFHADNNSNTTTKGTPVDVDTRWPKVLSVGVRTMRRCIDRALQRHERVTVITEIGNHDRSSAVMLALCLAQFYEREPRVHIDTSPEVFHWYRFGEVLIGTHHGHEAKMEQLPGVMACDRKADWGETSHRYWYTGHVHHTTVREFPGCTVETLRTLAPSDAWHRSKGYRSGHEMVMDVIHRKHGKIRRDTVGISQLFSDDIEED